MAAPLAGFDDNVEFAIEPIYGVRVFYMGLDGLQSVHTQCTWRPGENHLYCYTPVTVATYSSLSNPWTEAGEGPVTDALTYETSEMGERAHDMYMCSCGFYAYHDRWHLIEQYRQTLSNPTSIVAVVAGTGKIILGTKGFRSEKARVVALAPSPINRGGFSRTYGDYLADLYGVPFYGASGKMLEAHPLTFKDSELEAMRSQYVVRDLLTASRDDDTVGTNNPND